MSRPLVLLDAAGVLVFDDDARWMSELADHCGLSRAEALQWLDQVAYRPWWSGQWQWPDFWQAFYDRFSVRVEDTAVFEHSWSSLRPLASLQYLASWAQVADLWLVSDHRSGWLLPALGEHLQCFQFCWVSDQVGLTKRDELYFDLLSRYLSGQQSPVFYLDDRQENLLQAARFFPSLRYMVADPAGLWTRWLERSLLGGA